MYFFLHACTLSLCVAVVWSRACWWDSDVQFLSPAVPHWLAAGDPYNVWCSSFSDVKLLLPIRRTSDGSCSAGEQFWFHVTLLDLVARGMCPAMLPEPRTEGLAKGSRSWALLPLCSGHRWESTTQGTFEHAPTCPGMDHCCTPVGVTWLLRMSIPVPGSVPPGRRHALLATSSCSLCALSILLLKYSTATCLLGCWLRLWPCGKLEHASACVKPHKPEPDPAINDSTACLQCAGCGN